jgi:hypothetical protein
MFWRLDNFCSAAHRTQSGKTVVPLEGTSPCKASQNLRHAGTWMPARFAMSYKRICMPARFALNYKHTNKSARTVCCGNRKQLIGDLIFVVTISCFFFNSFVPSAKLPPINRYSAVSKLRWWKLCIWQKETEVLGILGELSHLLLCYSCSVKLLLFVHYKV